VIKVLSCPDNYIPSGAEFSDGDFAETLLYAYWPDGMRVDKDGIVYTVYRATLIPESEGPVLTAAPRQQGNYITLDELAKSHVQVAPVRRTGESGE